MSNLSRFGIPDAKMQRSRPKRSLVSTADNDLIFKASPNRTAIQITPEFAYELLLCEMDLECIQPATKELVVRMFELYKQAVEHFNIRGDPREWYFAAKLHHLTNHPSVLDMLHRENQREDNFYRKRKMERLVEISVEQTHNEIEQMIRKVEDAGRRNGQTVRKNLDSQVTAIEKRRQARRNGSKASEEDQQQSILQIEEQFGKWNCGKVATTNKCRDKENENVNILNQQPEDCRCIIQPSPA